MTADDDDDDDDDSGDDGADESKNPSTAIVYKQYKSRAIAGRTGPRDAAVNFDTYRIL